MIDGTFRDDWPYITLTLAGDEESIEVEFIVDTGFSGALAMPDALLQRIGADYVGSDRYQLADGTTRRFGFASVEVSEAGRSFAVLAKEGSPLAGIELFRDMHLHIEVAEGGAVLAESL